MKSLDIINDKIETTTKYFKTVSFKYWVKGDTSVFERMCTLKNKLDKLYIIKKDLEILEILKLCGETRNYELQIYLSNRTDCNIGNGIKEYEAFERVKEWLENE